MGSFNAMVAVGAPCPPTPTRRLQQRRREHQGSDLLAAGSTLRCATAERRPDPDTDKEYHPTTTPDCMTRLQYDGDNIPNPLTPTTITTATPTRRRPSLPTFGGLSLTVNTASAPDFNNDGVITVW
jgi:hypothetical protein